MSEPTNHPIETNAGRCDICGEIIDMRDGGDILVLEEYGIQDEDFDEITDEEAIEAVADAMERLADSGAGYELAQVMRDDGQIRVHQRCLDDTNYSLLLTPKDADWKEDSDAG